MSEPSANNNNNNKDVSKMTDEELDKAMEGLREAAMLYRQAQQERGKRDDIQYHKQKDDKRKELLNSAKFKDFKQKYEALSEELELLKRPQAFEFNIPVTFTLKLPSKLHFSRYNDYLTNPLCDLEYDVKATVGEYPAFTKKQQKLLQVGLTQVVEHACQGIMILFPELLEQNKEICRRLNKIMRPFYAWCDRHGFVVTVEDLIKEE